MGLMDVGVGDRAAIGVPVQQDLAADGRGLEGTIEGRPANWSVTRRAPPAEAGGGDSVEGSFRMVPLCVIYEG